MARKNLLAGLTDAPLAPGAKAPALPLLATTGSRGAIGAVSRSIEQIKAAGVSELDAALIDPSFINDRLTGSDAAHQELLASIREHGQQVPILVRPHPDKEGRYQIAYGRRRLRALAELGSKVRAVVKPLTDQQLVVAQGQENSARTDLSFIEKALFAHRLEQGGYDRDTIMAALSVDKTSLSRLISSAVKIPHDLIEAIGPAPKAGRDRWVELTNRLAHKEGHARADAAIAKESFAGKPSDERFNAVFNALMQKPAAAVRARTWKAADGTQVARIREDDLNLLLAIDKKAAGGFARYLVDQLPELYAAFKRGDEQP